MAKRLVILGAGPAGYVAALKASAGGLDVTLIGTHDTGGTCLQRGCVPTKTLVSSCDVLDKIQRADQYGIHVNGTATPDWPSQQRRMAKVVATMTGGITGLLTQRGVTQIPGYARFVDRHTVELTDSTRLHADYFLICTGSAPLQPSLFPFDGERVAVSDDVLKWDHLPKSLVIVGGGVIACEFAFIFQMLGVDVTVIEATDRPLPGEDRDISMLMAREMRKRRIRFVPSAMVDHVELQADSVVCHQNGSQLAAAERVLVAIGRRPHTEGLQLEAAGIRTGGRGEIEVDGVMQTSASAIYAAGDVTAQLMLAHMAYAQAGVAVDHMLGKKPHGLLTDNIPRVTFTHPEVASVGITEQTARDRGLNVLCGTFDFRALGKAHAMGELVGTVKVVGNADNRQLLGVHMMGAHSAEMIHEAVIVLNRGGTVDEICSTVHAHPTLSEAILEAAEAVFGAATHKPFQALASQDIAHDNPGRLAV
ncbi:MAG: dihydrolipoyl dehydrogenase [Thiohalobacteraceae bacterium]